MKTSLILGGGGFIGGHLAKKLKEQGYWVRIVDIKPKPEFWDKNEICDEYWYEDLRDPKIVDNALRGPKGRTFDEVYQLAADMGGAGYIFTGENDAEVMHNSALINLNVVHSAVTHRAKRIFYSSSACIYPTENQTDSNNPNCEESSAYPANPDSEYGWEKLFSERLYLSYMRNHNLNIRIARFHNIYGPKGTYKGGREKAPAAMCRKAIEADGELEVWGNGKQTRSFLYIEDCVNATLKFMRQDKFQGPVNIGSEEMVSINKLARIAIIQSNKYTRIKNIQGQEFQDKYGHPTPLGVNGRNSDNKLYEKEVGSLNYHSLSDGMAKTYKWIETEMK